MRGKYDERPVLHESGTADKGHIRSRKKIRNLLRQVKAVRNACAHSSAIINGFAAGTAKMETNNSVYRALAETGASHRARTSKMKNQRVKQMVTLFYLYSILVARGGGRAHAVSSLFDLEAKMKTTADLMPKNEVIGSTTSFLLKVIDGWFKNGKINFR